MVSSGRNAFWLLTSGSMSTEFAASPLMGTAKLPNPTAPMKAANHPTTALGSDIVSPRVRAVALLAWSYTPAPRFGFGSL